MGVKNLAEGEDKNDSSASQSAKKIQTGHETFFDLVEPFRSELHQYALGLSGSVWDAEKIVQTTLAQASVNLSGSFDKSELAKPRSYLLRVMTHIWLDQRVTLGETLSVPQKPKGVLAQEKVDPQEFLKVTTLEGYERAAFMLHDFFGLPLEETSYCLKLSPQDTEISLQAARKAFSAAKKRKTPLLHALSAKENTTTQRIDQFIEAYNQGKFETLGNFLQESVSFNIMGFYENSGKTFAQEIMTFTSYEEGFAGVKAYDFGGEKIVAVLYKAENEDAVIVGDFWRFEIAQDGKSFQAITSYFFCPETIAFVCDSLDIPFKTSGYRY